MKINPLALAAFAFAVRSLSAAEIKWHPDANMDSQLFPSLILATATQRPDDDEEQDPEVLGDQYGPVGVSITSPAANTKVQVTVLENGVMAKSTWSGVLEKAGVEYYVAPKVNFKFEQLRQTRQQVPLNVSFAVEVDGKSAGEQTETLTLRTINDCPFGVSDEEATIKDDDDDAAREKQPTEKEDTKPSGYEDMGWMFAAYVNENSPIVEQILKDALEAESVDHFAGYQGDADAVMGEVFAIWSALQARGIKYSNITTTAGSSDSVYSQHVRFVDESVANEQANCVDGSVLFCSILRKLGLRSFLVSVPGHMYMGFYLSADGEERVAVETTMIGATLDPDAGDIKVTPALKGLHDSLDEETVKSDAWRTFAAAVYLGTKNLAENAEKFEADNEPQYQITDVNDSRQEGIMPISYLKPE